ncbi:hypothetical protein JW905_11135 [bacterium]|nr:hypothetical protein [candidate division CSSED10-310 bacterium]
MKDSQERSWLDILEQALDGLQQRAIDGLEPSSSIEGLIHELVDYRRRITVRKAQLNRSRHRLRLTVETVDDGRRSSDELLQLQADGRVQAALALFRRDSIKIDSYYKLRRRLQVMDEEMEFLDRCLARTDERLLQARAGLAEIREEALAARRLMEKNRAAYLLDHNRIGAVITEVREELRRIGDMAKAEQELALIAGRHGVLPLLADPADDQSRIIDQVAVALRTLDSARS